jgi:hypothetical protein
MMVEKLTLIFDATRRFGVYDSSLDYGGVYRYQLTDQIRLSLIEDDFSSRLTLDFDEAFKSGIRSCTLNRKKIDNEMLMEFLKENSRGDFMVEKTVDVKLLNEMLDYLDMEFNKAEILSTIKLKMLMHFTSSLTELDRFLESSSKALLFFKGPGATMDDLYRNPIKLKWIDGRFIQNYGYNNSFRLIEFLSATPLFQQYKRNFQKKDKSYELELFTAEGEYYCGCKKSVL